ncbi:hypothetical protein [Bacillus sp. ISL-7]|uniref:hypothetical protein n=1 Tax=Bacillus sp. ISL-7 TaxID=2819136 RepID=UPI001BEB9F32|nr:hypothetical protein [Bacillus sp. ISL-7]MBT2736220.1 hypothetical protein [Bacillus sp. ISL-7]
MEQQQQEGTVYRGIKLAESGKLYKKDGSYVDKVKGGIDCFIDRLNELGHEILNEYVNSQTKVLVDFKCGHDPHWLKPNHYTRGIGCPKCRAEYLSDKFSLQAKNDFPLLVKSKGHTLLSEYVNSRTKVLIDFNCGHPTQWVMPPDYKYEHGCMECGRERTYQNVKLKSDNAKLELEKLLKENGHEWVCGKYVSGHTKILVDFKCGHEPSWISPSGYKTGNRCRRCVGTSSEQSKEDLMRVVEERGHVLLSEYTSSKGKVLIN